MKIRIIAGIALVVGLSFSAGWFGSNLAQAAPAGQVKIYGKISEGLQNWLDSHCAKGMPQQTDAYDCNNLQISGRIMPDDPFVLGNPDDK